MKPEFTLRALLLVAVLSALVSGCSLVSIDSKTRYRDAEGYFEPHLLDQIKPGETSSDWMRDHFGRLWLTEVDALVGYPEDLSIDTWRFERERQKSTRVFLLFRSRKLDQQYEYLHTVTEGDTVVRAWRDDLDTVDTRRLLSAMGYSKMNVGDKAGVQRYMSPMEKPAAANALDQPFLPTTMQDPPPAEAEAASSEQVQSVPPPAALKVEDVPTTSPAQPAPTREEPEAKKATTADTHSAAATPNQPVPQGPARTPSESEKPASVAASSKASAESGKASTASAKASTASAKASTASAGAKTVKEDGVAAESGEIDAQRSAAQENGESKSEGRTSSADAKSVADLSKPAGATEVDRKTKASESGAKVAAETKVTAPADL